MDIRKALLLKSFRIFNNRKLSLLRQQARVIYIQEEKARMSINVPYIEGTSKKL